MADASEPLDQPPATLTIGQTLVAVDDVQLIAAETGLNFTGGEMMVWKRNAVITRTARFVVPDTPEGNAASFHRWLSLCPQAAGILPDGSLRLPRIAPASQEDPLEIFRQVMHAVNRELRRQILRALPLALVLIAGGVGLVVLVIRDAAVRPNQAGNYKLGVVAIVLVVSAFLLAIRAFSLLRRRNRIRHVLRDIIHRGELNVEALAPALAPVGPPPIPAVPHVPLIPAVLAVLAIVLMLCPLVGLAVSLVALALTFRHPTWARTLAIVGSIVGLLTTALALILAQVG